MKLIITNLILFSQLLLANETLLYQVKNNTIYVLANNNANPIIVAPPPTTCLFKIPMSPKEFSCFTFVKTQFQPTHAWSTLDDFFSKFYQVAGTGKELQAAGVINKAHLLALSESLKNRDGEPSKNAPQDWRYTQTEGFLKIIMDKPGERYEDDVILEENIKNFFKFYMGPIFSALDFKSGIGLENDAELVKLTQKIIGNENNHKNMFVFYHAANETIAFLYQIYSEFRHQIMIRGDSSVDTLRALDTAFAVAASMDNFLKSMDELEAKNAFPPGNPWYNYLPGYVGAVINANNYLFGNYTSPGECTWCYFLIGHSAANLLAYGDWNVFLKPLFLALGFKDEQDIKNRIEKYKDYFSRVSKQSQEMREASSLANHRAATGVKGNGILLQIFIAPEIVDQMSYFSEWGGPKLKLKVSENTATTYKPGEILPLLRKDPLAFEKMLRNNYDNFKNNGYPKEGPSWEKLSILTQSRLLLAPKFLYSPLVKIYDYRRFPKTYPQDFNQAVAKMVSLDLVDWLEKLDAPLQEVTLTPAKEPGIPAEIGQISGPHELKELWRQMSKD